MTTFSVIVLGLKISTELQQGTNRQNLQLEIKGTIGDNRHNRTFNQRLGIGDLCWGVGKQAGIDWHRWKQAGVGWNEQEEAGIGLNRQQQARNVWNMQE